MQRFPKRCDIAVITVLPEEYRAVVDQLTRPSKEELANNYAWTIGEITHQRSGEAFRVVTAMALDPGNASGALATGSTIWNFEPRYVFLVGIAGGFNKPDAPK